MNLFQTVLALASFFALWGCGEPDKETYLVRDGVYLPSTPGETNIELHIMRAARDSIIATICIQESDSLCEEISSTEKRFEDQCYTQFESTCEMEVFQMDSTAIVLATDTIIVDSIQAWFKDITLFARFNSQETTISFSLNEN
jgi:hypothetical protein